MSAKYARKRATFREMSIGPEEAESILATTRGNRNLNQRHVHSLSRAMSAGAWRFNGDAIRFDKRGRLIHGFPIILAQFQGER